MNAAMDLSRCVSGVRRGYQRRGTTGVSETGYDGGILKSTGYCMMVAMDLAVSFQGTN